MQIEMTAQQLAAVEKGEPLRITVTEANTDFVLLRADLYDRVKALILSNATDPEEMYPLLAEIAPEDWEDPSVYGITEKQP